MFVLCNVSLGCTPGALGLRESHIKALLIQIHNIKSYNVVFDHITSLIDNLKILLFVLWLFLQGWTLVALGWTYGPPKRGKNSKLQFGV